MLRTFHLVRKSNIMAGCYEIGNVRIPEILEKQRRWAGVSTPSDVDHGLANLAGRLKIQEVVL